MEGLGGGSSTPSYSNVVSNRSKEVSLNTFRNLPKAETKTIDTHKLRSSISQEKEGTHKEARQEKIPGDTSQRTENMFAMGPCKPKANIKPRVLLNDQAL